MRVSGLRCATLAAVVFVRRRLFASRQGLADSEARWRLLLNSVVDRAVYMLDLDGRIASWNPGAELIKGYRADEILGRDFALFFTPEHLANGEPQRVLATARECGKFEGECWRMRKDGSRFWARVSLTAIRDGQGRLSGFAKVAHDLTGRKIAEAQREIIIEAAPNGMLIVDEAGNITLANSQAEAIFGYPRGTLAGQAVETLLPEALRAGHVGLRAHFNRGGQGMSPARQFTGRRQDGSTVWVEIMLSPVETPQGRIAVASIFDATDRLRQQQARDTTDADARADAAATNARLEQLATHLGQARDHAQQASEAKSRFLAGVTHELRTPLNGILGYAQLLQLEGSLNPAQGQRVAAMLEAGEHLLGMINAVLDLSQIELDRLELQSVEIDPPDLARACLDLVRPAAQAKSLALGLSVAADAPTRMHADKTRLRQMLVNLLGNAVKFTLAGRVELRLLRGSEHGQLRLEVVDTGPGIAPDQRERLFREFERLDGDGLGAVEGSGLGLAITARLAQRMGGRLGYDASPGGGSIFWLELPEAGPAAPPGLAQASPPAAVAPDAGPLRVLVVDDVEMNRVVAEAFLRLAGHHVVAVDSGPAAIDAVSAQDFDVVLMDVRMPGMDGLEATRRIRALPSPRGSVPVVAMTAQAFADQIAKCHAAGMNSHVSKPLQNAALLAVVADAAARSVTNGLGVVRSPPLLDAPTFDETSRLLPPDQLLRYLRVLLERGEGLVQRLQAAAPGQHGADVADAAHLLGGSAGTFGFHRLADAARRFERSVQMAGPDIGERAAELANVAELSVAMLREIIGATSASA